MTKGKLQKNDSQTNIEYLLGKRVGLFKIYIQILTKKTEQKQERTDKTQKAIRRSEKMERVLKIQCVSQRLFEKGAKCCVF